MSIFTALKDMFSCRDKSPSPKYISDLPKPDEIDGGWCVLGWDIETFERRGPEGKGMWTNSISLKVLAKALHKELKLLEEAEGKEVK